jgi:hypothetical protein
VVAQAAASAASAGADSSYGVLAQTVATAGSLIAAAAALSLCWKGRFAWEPAEQDVPRSAQKFGGLMIAVLIAIMWYRFTKQKRLTDDDLILLSIIFGAISLVALVSYGILIGVYVYLKVVVVSGTTTANQKIIGGFWLTPAARSSLRSGDPRPGTIGVLFAGAAYDEDLVWSRISRALAKGCFQLAYVALIAGGTCALAAISLLIASAA